MAKPLMFGDSAFEDDKMEAIAAVDGEWDRSYVPGNSERVRENDTRSLRGLAPLPVAKLKWIPCSKPDGSATDMRDMMPWFQLGYKYVEFKDFADLGITEIPPSAMQTADGLIRRGDLALAFVGEDRAKHNTLMQARINAEQQGTTVKGNVEVAESKSGVGSLMEVYDTLAGEREHAAFSASKGGKR